MSNKEKIPWFLGAALLVFLFLLSSTDLIIKEKKPEIYPISVVVEDENDEFYVNFKKGLDKAALSFQADVSFIMLYQGNDEAEQLELLHREIKDGARAVILSPVNETGTLKGLMELSPGFPVVLFGAQSSYDLAAGTIAPDYYAMGRSLGEEIAKREDPAVPVHMLTEGLSFTGNGEAAKGVESVLTEAGFTVHAVEKQSEDSFRRLIEETVYPGDGHILAVALDTPSLLETARIIGGSSVYQDHVTGLYGIGSTVEILNWMDKGIIKGLAVYDQYDAGYLSVRQAVEAVQGGRESEPTILEHCYIEREDLTDERYEKMLYPME